MGLKLPEFQCVECVEAELCSDVDWRHDILWFVIMRRTEQRVVVIRNLCVRWKRRCYVKSSSRGRTKQKCAWLVFSMTG